MAIRTVVKIDEDLCNGCGDCVPSCAEGAIQIINGKAKLVSDNLCDGIGACLGDCPMNAITIEKREADDFDEIAVKKHLSKQTHSQQVHSQQAHKSAQGLSMENNSNDHGCGCQSSKPITFDTKNMVQSNDHQQSALGQWPVQLHLLSPVALYFKGADVLLAADCVAFSAGDFHSKHLVGKTLAIACPKLDSGLDSYLEKLIAMIDKSKINTLTVMVMEVPCCTGLVALAKEAVTKAIRKVPVKKIVISIKGDLLSEDWI